MSIWSAASCCRRSRSSATSSAASAPVDHQHGAHRHRVGGRPDDHAALRRRQRSIPRPGRPSRRSGNGGARSTIARRTAVQTATQSWETLQAARASIASFVAAVRAAQIALEGTQQEALVGSRTVLDVLIAEQQLFTTQSQLVTAQHDAALGEYTLVAAIGRLIAPGLEAAGRALRHGAPLQAGQRQMVRVRRRAEGVASASPAGDRWRICVAGAWVPGCRSRVPAMSDAKSPQDLSMDEILATIRRIIAEDEQSSSRPRAGRGW